MKANIDSAARMNKPIKAYGDSAEIVRRLGAQVQRHHDGKLPAKVVFTEFTPDEAKTTLGGTVTNQTDRRAIVRAED